MDTPQTIKLYKTQAGWVTRHSDPKVKELFGSDVLPTAYTTQAPASQVYKEIVRLNPDCSVVCIER